MPLNVHDEKGKKQGFLFALHSSQGPGGKGEQREGASILLTPRNPEKGRRQHSGLVYLVQFATGRGGRRKKEGKNPPLHAGP